MDIQIPFIFISLFSLASVLLIFIYKFGIKEKSYEEALAEQRQQTHSLLGIKPKSNRDKKSKKTAKKMQPSVKEKSNVESDDKVDESESSENNKKNNETVKKPHVEFKEVVEDVNAKNVGNKKQTKKDKMRPILVHKEDDSPKSIITETTVFPTNHFEELHPKDDYELLRSVSSEETATEVPQKQISKAAIIREESQKQVTKATAKVEPQKHVVKFENESSKQIQEKSEIIPLQKENNSVLTPGIMNGIISNTGKEKKKKKSEFNTLQQLADAPNGPNITVLLDLLCKAELSRSEIQILIDLLLNKQHDSPAIVDEWSEGKSDPVQKLKKQLAEKEKLLSEEQQIVASAQAKLREIRSEHQNEKTVLQQKIRSLEEMIHTKQMEATRNHQQVQQLQAQVKEELVKYHKLREEHAAVQMQRQQYEIRLSQTQESEVIMNQLQNEIQELSSINNQLRLELTRITEENIAEKERTQSYIIELNNFQKELDQLNERNRQQEEIRLKMERDVESFIKGETDLKSEISHLNSIIQQKHDEARRLELNLKQMHDDLQKHKDESNKMINQLTTELQETQEENVQIKMQQMNGSLQKSEQHEVEVLNLHNELTSLRSQLNHIEIKSENELKTANGVNEKLRQELEDLKKKFEEEKFKLEEQKLKNNELRTKNWKVMEALNVAESRLKNNTSKVRTKSDEEVQREFVQRLFPEIKDAEVTDLNVFKTEGEKFITNYVNNLKKQSIDQNTQFNEESDSHQLKLQLQHYKNVIDNTEKMLNKLQNHIEQEEIKWRVQLAAKTAELDSIKEKHEQELQKLTALEIELKKEQEDKKKMISQMQKCENYAQAQNSSNGLH